MKAVLKTFENRLAELTEQDIENLSKTDHSIFNVMKGFHKEAFGTFLWNDDNPNFDYFLTYVTNVNQKLEGFILKLQPFLKKRNELTTCFTSFICKKYQSHQVGVFNAYQDQQRALFERYDYWTYGNELAKELGNTKGNFYLKNHKGILFVPFAKNEENEKKEIKSKKITTKNIDKQQIHFVYIMLNKRNEYYKIGRSKNPEFREKTLQAEEPNIILIEKWVASKEIENILHRKYKTKRIRGEWFNLNETDIEEIRDFMGIVKSKKKRKSDK